MIVPLILLVGFRSAWALYTCRVDGVVRSSCCCKNAHKRADTSDERVFSASCCAVEVQAPTKAPEVQAPARADVDAAPAVIAIVAQAPLAPRIVTVARRDRSFERPPPIATFLVKQSFLR